MSRAGTRPGAGTGQGKMGAGTGKRFLSYIYPWWERVRCMKELMYACEGGCIFTGNEVHLVGTGQEEHKCKEVDLMALFLGLSVDGG